jgi:hypothetical protein
MLSPAHPGTRKKQNSQAVVFVYFQIESNLAKPSYSKPQTDQRNIAHAAGLGLVCWQRPRPEFPEKGNL